MRCAFVSKSIKLDDHAARTVQCMCLKDICMETQMEESAWKNCAYVGVCWRLLGLHWTGSKFNCWVLHPVACVSTNTLIKTTVRNKCFFFVVHNKIEHEKHLLRTMVLIKVLVVQNVYLWAFVNTVMDLWDFFKSSVFLNNVSYYQAFKEVPSQWS
jgi:hypothetical protein